MENKSKHMINHSYTVEKTSLSRLFTHDIGQIGRKRHHIPVITEFDITTPRKFIRENKKQERISFTSWLLKQIATATEKHKKVHAVKLRKNKIIIFDAVDISLTVEKRYQNQLIPIPLIVRNANKKSIRQIFDEIESAKNQDMSDESDFVLAEKQNKFWIRLFASLPQWLRLMLWRMILSNPLRVKKMMGTVMFTSINTMSRTSNWFIPKTIHSLCFGVSNICKRKIPVNNDFEEREFLQMTILIDHDVVDGMPMARFIKDLKRLIENPTNTVSSQ